MEKEYQVSWFKVIGIIVVFVIIIGVLCVVYPRGKKNNNTSTNYINNITLMKNAGFEYFQGNNLPDKIGESSKLTLDEMVSSNLIVEFTDDTGKTCNKDDSYVQVTKSLEDEFSMKVFLSCEDKTDYIVTTIVNKENNNTDNNNNDNDDKNNSSNNVADKNNNNQSNNNQSSSGYVKPGNTVNNITYNINYVNNCGTCTGSNCNKNCVNNVYYTVTYISNNGTVGKETVKSGNTAPYKTVTRSGYKFLGWYLDGVKYDFSTPVTKKITLIAKWQKADSEENIYTVTFKSQGSIYDSQEVYEGNTVSRPTNPTRACYSFDGWYTNSSLTNKYNFSNPVTKNMTLYAKWVENDSCRDKYTIYFESNGGTNVNSQTRYEGEKVTKPANPTKACYSFDGWYTNSSLTREYNFSNYVTKDMTLYAKWVDDGSCRENYRVRFDSNGGTSVSTQWVEEGTRASEPKNPTRSGYTFDGWYLNNVEFSFKTRIYNNITLVAKWIKDDVKYNTYCKIENERIYSTGYVGKTDINDRNYMNYNYQLKYVNRYAKSMKVIDYGNISNSEYTKAYNYWKSYNKPITMVNGSGNSIDVGSGTNLKTYSLKSSNFSTTVRYESNSGSNWYFRVYNNLYSLNYTSTPKYYTSNTYYVYFMPLYFDIEYTNLSNCKNDLASKSSNYRDYEIVDTYWN